MNVYKAKYHTLSKGQKPDGELGNLAITHGTAMIEADSTSECQNMLTKHYEENHREGESHLVPVITSLESTSIKLITKRG